MMHFESELRNYQHKAIDFLLENPQAALFLDMGLGKTVSSLTAIKQLKEAGLLGPGDAALVIAPERVARTVWKQEAAQWDHLTGLRVSRIVGDEARRFKALQARADVFVLNVENTKWLFNKALPAIMRLNGGRCPFKILILDESTKFKRNSTERFKAIRHKLKLFERRWILTGTPAPNSLQELWAQIYILDEGERLGTAFDRFKQRFFMQMDYEGHRWEARNGARDYITNLIRDVTLRMDAEDWLELPPVLVNDVMVELPEDARRIYDRFEREMFIQLEHTEIMAFNAAALTGKCWQFANGAVYDDPEARSSFHVFHEEKLDALEQVMENTGRNMLIVYNFKHDLDRILKRFKEEVRDGELVVFAGKKTEEIEQRWNEGKIPRLLVHPQNTSHGLNIQFGGSAITFFSMTWSGELYKQIIRRLQRPGQEADNVLVNRILADETTDMAIVRSLRDKDETEQGMLDALNTYRAEREMLA